MTKKIVCYEEEKSSIMSRFYSASITYNQMSIVKLAAAACKRQNC